MTAKTSIKTVSQAPVRARDAESNLYPDTITPGDPSPKQGIDEEKVDELDQLIEELEAEDTGGDLTKLIDGVGGRSQLPESLLQTDPTFGIDQVEVLARRKRYGLNQLKEESESLLLKSFGYFVGPIQFVMMAAAFLAAGLHDWVDLGVICCLPLLNAAVGFIQEFQAGSVVGELGKTLAQAPESEAISEEYYPEDIWIVCRPCYALCRS